MSKYNREGFLGKLSGMVAGYFKRNLGILLGILALSVLLTILTDSFLDISNILNIIRQVSINAMLAFGISFALILGGVDLSVGSVVATSGIMAVLLIRNGLTVEIAIFLTLLLGLGIGLINGSIITFSGMHPFVVTLAMQMIVRGLGYIITSGLSVSTTDSRFSFIGNGYVGAIPVPVIILAAVMMFMAAILNRTRFGRRIYAVGGNRDAALYSGINVKRVEIGVYVICGLMAAISGIVLASRMYSGQPTSAQGYEGDAIAASVLGGASMRGGIGTIGGALLGAVMIGILSNGMNLLQIPSYWQSVVKGIVIMLAVYIDILKRRREQK